MQVLGIFAGNKDDGITAQMLDAVLAGVTAPNTTVRVNLNDYDLAMAAPRHPNRDLGKLDELLIESDVWVIATPTYWGHESGSLKRFFDALRYRLVRIDHQGGMHPGRFKNKHYLTLTNCYQATWVNLTTPVTDATFQTVDRVLGTAGLIKLGEAVQTNTWQIKHLPEKKRCQLTKLAAKINRSQRKDDQTMKRYLELFAVVALMTLATMGIQAGLAKLWPVGGFWWTYCSFVVIFFALLATILHWLTVRLHARK